MTSKSNIIEFDKISVSFGATRALSEVSFSVAPGEIVGLLGHNGAGKSTLFNVTSGAISASSGSFTVEGRDVGKSLSPREANDLGISIIHQEPALAPNLSVLDNLFLARSVNHGVDKRTEARRALARVGADLPLDLPVESLNLGQRQLVDLARGTLSGQMKVLLLDEPTAALGKAETDSLHALIRNFADQGVAVIYVSHRLPDIIEACTRIAVLRGGELVVDGPVRDFTPERLAEALVPKLRQAELIETSPAEIVAAIETHDGPVTVRAGEVVGLFGMAGGEQFDIASQLGGAAGSAEFEFCGETVRIKSPREAIRKKIFYLPPDRDKDGLIATETAKDNVMLPWYGDAGGFWVSPRSGHDVYETSRRELQIQGPTGSAEITQFSGGNRQKHLLARWLYPAEPKLLVLAQPTQGVDVGAKLDIVEGVRTAAKNGAAVLVASSESDEISSMCDRSYVMAQERISSVEKTDEFNAVLLAELLSASETTTA